MSDTRFDTLTAPVAPASPNGTNEPNGGDGAGASTRRPLPGKRRLVAAGAFLAVVAGGLAFTQAGSDTSAGGAGAGASETATAEVARRDLSQTETLDGTLGYAEAATVVTRRTGVLTRLAPEGSTVEAGGVLYTVDGYSVVLMYGAQPAYRVLDVNAANGADVRQLEENLVALGYATRSNLGVDDDFTDATTAAVKRWQADLGVAEDGVVRPGDVVFLPGAVRVGGSRTALGANVQMGGPVLDVTSVDRVVTVALKATKSDLVAVGEAVEVVLPGGKAAGGVVESIGTVARAAEPGADPTVDVTITLDEGATVTALDQAPVDVNVTKSTATNVLTVPVTALLALAEGGYAVEVADGSVIRLVAVKVGSYADGYAEVSGSGLAEGVTVVVPA